MKITVDLSTVADALGHKLRGFSRETLGSLDIPMFMYDKRLLVTITMAALETRAKEHLRWFNGELQFDAKVLDAVVSDNKHLMQYEQLMARITNKIRSKKINSVNDIITELLHWYDPDDPQPAATPLTAEYVQSLKLLMQETDVQLKMHLEKEHELYASKSPEHRAYMVAVVAAKHASNNYYEMKNQVTTFSTKIGSQMFYFRDMTEYHTYLFNRTVLEPFYEIIDHIIKPILDGDEWAYWVVKQHSDVMAHYELRGDWLRIRALELIENEDMEHLFLC